MASIVVGSGHAGPVPMGYDSVCASACVSSSPSDFV